MVADVNQLCAAVREQWAYLEDRSANFDLDLDAVRTASIVALEEAQTRAEFADVLRKFVAMLQDGHGNVSIECGEPKPQYMLLTLRSCAEGAVVTDVGDEITVSNEESTPRRGDLLTAIDGEPIVSLLRDRQLRVLASTQAQRHALALRGLRKVTADEVSVELADTKGERHTARLRTRAWPLVPEREDNWSLSFPEEGVALLRIQSFAVKDWKAWLEAKVEDRDAILRADYERIALSFDELAETGARALILDLRDNGGGTDLLGQRIAMHLLEAPFTYYQLSARGDNGWREPFDVVPQVEKGLRVFDGQVIALINERCFSTTDNLLRCLRDLHPRFRAVGRPTGGGTGAPGVIATLKHSGAKISLCTMRVLGPKGDLIEGRGTKPDVPVIWTRLDVLEDRDADLKTALRLLRE